MSASAANTAIYLTDSPKVVRDKVETIIILVVSLLINSNCRSTNMPFQEEEALLKSTED